YEVVRADNIEPPEAGQAAIECLLAPVRGFSCSYMIQQDRTDHHYHHHHNPNDAERHETEPCGHISTNRKKIGKHCRDAHGWKSTPADHSESSGDGSNNDDTGSDSDEANSVHDANTNTDPDDGRYDDDDDDNSDNSDTDLQHD
ncbi:hypothetical protein KCU98_g17581, partial [Aureobasidium melanogenum]